MLDIMRKLEIDVLQANELLPAIDLASKYLIPSVVIHQSLVAQANMIRLARGGRFKILVPIDWHKGDTYSTQKFRGTTLPAFEADGFEILLTAGKNLTENKNEIRALTDFAKNYINSNSEIRFVLGSQTRPEDEILQMCKAMVGTVPSTIIRVDYHLKTQINKGGIDSQNVLAQRIKQIIDFPLKACGNFSTAKSVANCLWAQKIAVGLTQTQQIVREISRHPDGLRALLT